MNGFFIMLASVADCGRSVEPLSHFDVLHALCFRIVTLPARPQQIAAWSDAPVAGPSVPPTTQTMELNQVTDDIRGAQEVPEEAPLAIPK
jgi:hypothetical protein